MTRFRRRGKECWNIELIFEVPGRPQGKGRPRAYARGGHARVYTPEKTVTYESWIRLCYQQAYSGVRLEGPVALAVTAVFAVPRSYAKKKAAQCLAGEIWPTCKPDFDNILKAVADALNGVAYLDDSTVVRGSVDKRYGEAERLVVRLCGEAEA